MTEVHPVEIVRGRDLSGLDLDQINWARGAYNPDTSPIIIDKENEEDGDKPYFLARKERDLVAFGRIHRVGVDFMDETYQILGTATLVAIRRDCGYGKSVALEMTRFVKELGFTSIGFNEAALAPFYEKCGRLILPHGVKRFVYPGKPTDYPEDWVNYIPGQDGFIEKMLENENEKARISRPHW